MMLDTKMAKIPHSFGHHAPGFTQRCPLPLAPLVTSAIIRFLPLSKKMQASTAQEFRKSKPKIRRIKKGRLEVLR